MPDTNAASSQTPRRWFMAPGRWLAPVAFGALLLAGGTACSDAGAIDPTPVKVFKITPASGTSIPAAPATLTVGATGSPAASGAPIQLVGQDTKFDQVSLTAASGPVTIAFANKDAGTAHNVHVFAGKDAKATSAGQTELEVGPVDQELKLDLAPGVYYFQCDAHPTTMKGTLTVH